MKKNKISKSWVIRQRRDKYVRQSKLEGYRSRAVYKLKELDEKFKIIKNNLSILDVGSAPGSWTQYLSEKSKGSKIMSIDLKLNTGHYINEMQKALHNSLESAAQKFNADITKQLTYSRNLLYALSNQDEESCITSVN